MASGGFHALEAVKEDEKGRSTVVERTQYITRQKFFWIFVIYP